MTELTKKYKVVHRGANMLFPLTDDGDSYSVYPAADASYAEFDDYASAKKYVDENGLVYEESPAGVPE